MTQVEMRPGFVLLPAVSTQHLTKSEGRGAATHPPTQDPTCPAVGRLWGILGDPHPEEHQVELWGHLSSP